MMNGGTEVAQPVIDTLRLSNALQEAGVERAQAEGTAEALGNEFGEHVVVQSDLEAGFERVWGEFGNLRGEMDVRFERVWGEFRSVRGEMDAGFERVWDEFDSVRGEFKAVRAEMAVMRSDLEAKIESLAVRMDAGFDVLRGNIEAVNSKLNYLIAGFGLMLAFVSATTGVMVYRQVPPHPSPVDAAWTAPAASDAMPAMTTPSLPTEVPGPVGTLRTTDQE